MSTYAQDLKKSNPSMAFDLAITGNQSAQCLRNMIRALESMPLLNTLADNTRLYAARRILKRARGK